MTRLSLVSTTAFVSSVVALGAAFGCTENPGLRVNSRLLSAYDASTQLALTGAPTGASNAQQVTIVVGDGPTQYRYAWQVPAATSLSAVADSPVDCSEASAYGAAFAKATPIVLDLAAVPDGSVKLCVIGGSETGTWQVPAQASVAAWTKRTKPPTVQVVASSAANADGSEQVSVSSAGLVAYRFAYLSSNADRCDDASYGDFVSASIPLKVAPGQAVCVQGRDDAGNVQSAATLYAYGDTATKGVKSPVALNILAASTLMTVGNSQALTLLGTFADGTTADVAPQATWTSADDHVATVSSAAPVAAGLVKAVGPGATVIKATLAGLTVGLPLNVAAAASPVAGATTLTSLSVTAASPAISLGASESFAATGTYADASTQDLTSVVTWSSSSVGVATVSNAGGSGGLASSVATGTTTITATYAGLSGVAPLTVTGAALSAISVTPGTVTVGQGSTRQLSAIGTYADATTQDLTSVVTWTAATPAVSSISNAAGTHGLLTAVAPGSAIVSATLGAKSGSASVTVRPIPAAMVMTSPSVFNTSMPEVDWATVIGATTYGVEVFTDATLTTLVQSATGLTTPQRVLSAVADGSYSVRLRALDGSGWLIAEAIASIAVGTTPPLAFTIAAPMAYASVAAPAATWSASVGAISYAVKVSTVSNCASSVQSYASVAATSQALSPLSDGTYYLCVTAKDVYGNVTSATNNGYAFAIKTTWTGAFTINPPGQQLAPTVTAVWATLTGAASYDLTLSSNPACTAPQQTVTGSAQTTQSLNSVPVGIYYVCVLARDAYGLTQAASNNGQKLVVTSLTAVGQPALNVLQNTKFGFSAPNGIFGDGTRLFEVDSFNGRAQIWSAYPTSGQAPTVVLGQSDGSHTSGYNASATSLNNSQGICFDGTRLYIADNGFNRIAMWSSLPTVSQQPADLVLGQASFTASGSGASTIAAIGIHCDANHLFVADRGSNRILIWNAPPTSMNQAPDVILGQSLFTTTTANNGGLSASSLSGPSGVFYDGTRLYAADTTNNRVLIWNSLPTTNKKAADVVIGQSTFATNAAATTSTTYSSPTNVVVIGGKIVVSDSTNHRVLIYNAIPIAGNAAADVVLGQASFTSAATAVDASHFVGAIRVGTDGTRLMVSEYNGARILVWSAVPTASSTPPDQLLGQPNYTSSGFNEGSILSAASLYAPTGAYSDGVHLFVADTGNNRVLMWSAQPTSIGQAADIVLGQADFGGNVSGIDGSSLSAPSSVYSDGTRLYVADTGNNRVLIWDAMPTASHQAADRVLGQADFVSNASGGLATGLNGPAGVSGNGTKLIVADTANHRVLIWSTTPTGNQQSADLVLGQADFTGVAAATTASGMKSPAFALSDGTHLFVADSGNNRVLVWSTVPTTSAVAPSFALGQATMTTGSAGLSASAFSNPRGLAADGVRLVVADTSNNRVLVWSSVPTSQQAPASSVVGQLDLGSSAANVTSESLSSPSSVQLDGVHLWVADKSNSRIMGFPPP